jgi:hypothetical protein
MKDISARSGFPPLFKNFKVIEIKSEQRYKDAVA